MKLSAPSSPAWLGKADHEDEDAMELEPRYLSVLKVTEQDVADDPCGSVPIRDLLRHACGDSLLRTCIVSMSLYAPFIKSDSHIEFSPAKAIIASIADAAARYAWSRLTDALHKTGSKITVDQLSCRTRECSDPPGAMPVLESYGLPRAKMLLGHDCYLQDLEHTCVDSGLCTSVYGYIVDTSSKPGTENLGIENVVVESFFDLDDDNDLDKRYEVAGNLDHFGVKDWTPQYRREMRSHMEASVGRHNEKIAVWLGKQVQERLSEGRGVEDLVPGEDFGQYFADVQPHLDKFLLGALEQTREFFMGQMNGRLGL
ncbi:hypothetical protein ACHAPT_009023 [Fusarium lateritium]